MRLKQSTKKVVNIFNNISETADVPENYPQTPEKIKGLPSNLRPMTLLSTIRRILAAFISSRIKARVNNKMPSTILTL